MERDLFKPIKEYFEAMGYTCDGEVCDIDLYMERGEFSVAVELKQNLDFKAVQQAALRQKVTDTVYIGIFCPKDMRSHAFRDKVYLLKRLGIGLITVTRRGMKVSVVNEPVVSELSLFQSRNKGKKDALVREFSRRRVKNNIGGVTGEKRMTGYREDALLVLDAVLELGGRATTADIRKVSGVDNSTTIMRNNHYGWFAREERGVYSVTEGGLMAVEEFTEAIAALKGVPGD